MRGYFLERKSTMKNELTLCPKCLSDFAAKPNIMVYRVDYLQIEKEPCCFCQVRFGYDYVIEEKRNVKCANH